MVLAKKKYPKCRKRMKKDRLLNGKKIWRCNQTNCTNAREYPRRILCHDIIRVRYIASDPLGRNGCSGGSVKPSLRHGEFEPHVQHKF